MSSSRFVLLQGLLTFLAVLPLVLFTYLQEDVRLQDYEQQHLTVRSRNLLATYRNGGTPALSRAITERLTGGGQTDAAYLLIDHSGHILAGNVVAWPTGVTIRSAGSTAKILRIGHRQPERACLNTYQLAAGERLLIGSVRLADKRAQSALLEPILGALLVMLAIAVLVSRSQASYVSRRVKGITEGARAIASGDLSRRIETHGSRDEFNRLGAALNKTFERVQTLVEDLGFVTNALAHELRSPLTRVHADLERLASAKGAKKDAALRRMSAEIEGMLRTINATLDLSRAESNVGVSSFVPFEICELLSDLWEIYEAAAEERNISLVLGHCGKRECFGSRDLIAQALSNMLDNALKHSGATAIELGCVHRGSACWITVSDNGVGIAEDERAEAMRKFGRLDRARTSQGTGLGLPFVKAVADLHGGRALLEDNGPGLRVTLVLPARPTVTS